MGHLQRLESWGTELLPTGKEQVENHHLLVMLAMEARRQPLAFRVAREVRQTQKDLVAPC